MHQGPPLSGAFGSRHYAEAIFWNSPRPMAIVGTDNSFLAVNPAWSKMLGYTDSELTSLTWPEITVVSDVQPDQTMVNRLLAGELDSYTMTKAYNHRQGHVVPGEMTVNAVRDDEGRVDCLFVFFDELKPAQGTYVVERGRKPEHGEYVARPVFSLGAFLRDNLAVVRWLFIVIGAILAGVATAVAWMLENLNFTGGGGGAVVDWLLSFADGYTPRGSCGPWPEWVLGVYVVSHLMVLTSAVLISGLLGFGLLFERDRVLPLADPAERIRIGRAFGLFILTCGGGHLEGALSFLWPAYPVFVWWHLLTAAVSAWTLAVVVRHRLIILSGI